WKQASLAQNLEAVADAEHQTAAVGKLLHRLHDRRELGNCAGTQVVAIGKAAGHNDGVTILQIVRVMPEEGDRLLGHLLDGPVGIVIAVGSGKDDNAKFHLFFLFPGDYGWSLTRTKGTNPEHGLPGTSSSNCRCAEELVCRAGAGLIGGRTAVAGGPVAVEGTVGASVGGPGGSGAIRAAPGPGFRADWTGSGCRITLGGLATSPLCI